MTTTTRLLRFGPREVRYPSGQLAPLPAFTGGCDDGPALRERLARDGFLYLPRLLPEALVAEARARILAALAKSGETMPPLDRLPEISHHPAMTAAMDGAELHRLFAALFGEPARGHHHRFLRASGPGSSTGAHMDAIYMGRGTVERLLTCWVALDDAPLELGPLAILAGSHDAPSFAPVRDRYAALDYDRDRLGDVGWFSADPLSVSERYGGRWLSSDFAAGDVVVFGMRTMHASLVNLGGRPRLTCDVRFQPASLPADPRWADPGARGHDSWHRPVETVPMAEILGRLGL
jgi:hypothetical protein